jgi:hypothetical protein
LFICFIAWFYCYAYIIFYIIKKFDMLVNYRISIYLYNSNKLLHNSHFILIFTIFFHSLRHSRSCLFFYSKLCLFPSFFFSLKEAVRILHSSIVKKCSSGIHLFTYTISFLFFQESVWCAHVSSYFIKLKVI